VSGSNHYQRAPWGVHAYDYGDARNNPTELMAVMRYLRHHHRGVREAFFDPAGFYIKNGQIIKGSIGGHGDHLHLAY
jgi:hypothetical protein